MVIVFIILFDIIVTSHYFVRCFCVFVCFNLSGKSTSLSGPMVLFLHTYMWIAIKTWAGSKWFHYKFIIPPLVLGFLQGSFLGSPTPSFFFFFNKFIYLFTYFWLHWVFVAERGLSLVAVSGGYSSLLCVGFSLRWLLLWPSTGSRHAGFSSCSTRAQ